MTATLITCSIKLCGLLILINIVSFLVGFYLGSRRRKPERLGGPAS